MKVCPITKGAICRAKARTYNISEFQIMWTVFAVHHVPGVQSVIPPLVSPLFLAFLFLSPCSCLPHVGLLVREDIFRASCCCIQSISLGLLLSFPFDCELDWMQAATSEIFNGSKSNHQLRDG